MPDITQRVSKLPSFIDLLPHKFAVPAVELAYQTQFDRSKVRSPPSCPPPSPPPLLLATANELYDFIFILTAHTCRGVLM